MKLNSYGLLIGKITSSRPKRPDSPHWLLFVQPDDPNHPAYRAAVNLQTTERKHKSLLQYQIVEFGRRATPAGTTLIKKLTALGISKFFLPAISDSTLPRLDFVRGGFVNPKKFVDLRPGIRTLEMEFRKAVSEAQKSRALVAVFGSGYPVDAETGKSVPTGYTGIENIHMNQGTKNLINTRPHYIENAPNQDGGIIFLLPGGARGFFVKFHAQTTNTYDDGNPAETGIPEIDKVSPAIRKAIMPRTYPRTMAARRTQRMTASGATATLPAVARMTPPPAAAAGGKTNPPATANTGGYVFADVDPADASGQYIPDNDDNTYKTPYVMTRSSGKTRGPVPTPHVYPTMELSDILGANPPVMSATAAARASPST